LDNGIFFSRLRNWDTYNWSEFARLTHIIAARLVVSVLISSVPVCIEMVKVYIKMSVSVDDIIWLLQVQPGLFAFLTLIFVTLITFLELFYFSSLSREEWMVRWRLMCMHKSISTSFPGHTYPPAYTLSHTRNS
jgi:hypothetical protein